MKSAISLALIDDHVLLRKGLATMLEEAGFKVVIQADNGQQFISLLQAENLPQIVILDINMPVMDGYATAAWINIHYPDMHILVLSMNENDHAIIRMLRAGARGYIVKDCQPRELFGAIHSLQASGFYHSELVTGRMLHSLVSPNAARASRLPELTRRENEFLQLCCTEMTYKEIAEYMHLSPRTIDGYRDDLFEKLGVKSRVGLVLYAIKQGIVQV